MTQPSIESQRESEPPQAPRRLRLHPVGRVVFYLAAGFAGTLALQVGLVLPYALFLFLGGLGPEALAARLAPSEMPPWLLFALSLGALAWTLILTWAFRRWLDGLPLRDLGFARAGLGRDSGLGLGLGFAAMALILGAHLALGWTTARLRPPDLSLAGSLLASALALIPAAANEEIVYRGYVLQTLARWRGWRLGLAVSSIAFALAHALNPNVTLAAVANIALAGAVFGLLYKLSGQLWLPIAAHFAWNFAQGPVFGFPVSGLVFDGALQPAVGGPPLWTGGAFGPEGGLLVTALLAALLGLLLAMEARSASARPADAPGGRG